MALGLTLGWMLMCAGLFRLWEEEWSYFTAFYFFFVHITPAPSSPGQPGSIADR